MATIRELIDQIKKCTICADELPLGPNPVVSFSSNSKILVIGQAPGTKVHASGIPWDDQSGKLLREWLGVDNETFYNPDYFGIVPMGFCYPGKGNSGDLPPRKECAEKWHSIVLEKLTNVELVLLIGQYAQSYYLAENKKKNLTANVKAYEEFLPRFLPLPHPSPLNRRWFKQNPWFNESVVPYLKERITQLIG